MSLAFGRHSALAREARGRGLVGGVEYVYLPVFLTFNTGQNVLNCPVFVGRRPETPCPALGRKPPTLDKTMKGGCY